jgi:putative hydrolase of the HAD superfamily
MINWNDIDTVLLDMDGTLLDLHYDNHFWLEYLPAAYARKRQLPAPQATQELLARLDAARGHLHWYCLDHWSRQLDMDIPALKREIRHMIRIRPHALDFLRRLHAGPARTLLVTNAHPVTLDIKMGEVDIRPWFDAVVSSHPLGAAKEDPLFWQRLQVEHPFDPARTLLIDDTESVLDAAHAHGIAHLLTLLQPDSQKARRVDTRFPGIHHFDEIMPGALPV